MAGRALVSRPRQRERTLVGPCAGDQAAHAAGVLRAAVHVISSQLERAVPVERRGWRNADQVSSLGFRTDFRRASRRSCEGLDIHERWRAQTRLSEAPATVSATATGGNVCAQRA